MSIIATCSGSEHTAMVVAWRQRGSATAPGSLARMTVDLLASAVSMAKLSAPLPWRKRERGMREVIRVRSIASV